VLVSVSGELPTLHIPKQSLTYSLTRNKDTRTAGSNTGSGDAVANPSGSNPSGPGAAPSAASASASAAAARPTSGGQGSTIYFEDGTTMIYDNPHGGRWVDDPNDPFSNEAQCNSWTPALNQNWTWGIDKVHGVNLGGWFNTEPFIVPGLYEIYANGSAGTAVDEYTLSQNMGANLTAAMTEHYQTFITERDFAEIASAGLSWIRLPIGHWAVQKSPEEPFLERVSWQYILKALKWARKYGIRVNFDLHTMPGSQNGWNHSGHIGQINWMGGAMGLANAQRALEIIRTLTQFIVQPEYAPLIPLWGFVNEPNANALSKGAVGSFYREAYNMIRSITGVGEGKGPMLSVHDGFIGIKQWYDFMPGADRLSLDQHPYMVSTLPLNDDRAYI
jgi:glucan 1,3-beta-glucosidase